jgi:hypothetical protein
MAEALRPMQLAPEEPEAGPWRAELLSTLVKTMARREPGNAAPSRPVVLAVDGRSNAGKTTLAARICRVVPGSTVVHTDDIAWKHSRFGWADLLIEGILEPVHQGRAVSYRPPRWAEHGHRRGRCRAKRSGSPARRPDLGAIRRARGRTAGACPHRKAERGTNSPAPSRVAGRGETVQRRPANLGTRRRHCLRLPADPLRPRHRGRSRTPAGPSRLTGNKTPRSRMSSLYARPG